MLTVDTLDRGQVYPTQGVPNGGMTINHTDPLTLTMVRKFAPCSFQVNVEDVEVTHRMDIDQLYQPGKKTICQLFFWMKIIDN